MGEQAPGYVYGAFVLTYGTVVLRSSRDFLLTALVTAQALFFTIPIAAHLSDLIGRRDASGPPLIANDDTGSTLNEPAVGDGRGRGSGDYRLPRARPVQVSENFLTVRRAVSSLAACRQVTNYRKEAALPNPAETELLAKGTGESCSTAPCGSMPH
jgi:hypothetical protein